MGKKIWAKNADTGEMMQVDTDKINLNTPPRHDELSEDLINRIKAFKLILREVETMPLEQTIYNFRCDAHPENEVEIWESIAQNFKEYVSQHPDISLEEKRSIYKLFLERTLTGAS